VEVSASVTAFEFPRHEGKNPRTVQQREKVGHPEYITSY
jgi:hypothetical protein